MRRWHSLRQARMRCSGAPNGRKRWCEREHPRWRRCQQLRRLEALTACRFVRRRGAFGASTFDDARDGGRAVGVFGGEAVVRLAEETDVGGVVGAAEGAWQGV